jgi:Histone methylation protein DOT1
MKTKRSQATIEPVGNDGDESQGTRKHRVDAESRSAKAANVAATVTHVIEGSTTPSRNDARLATMRETPHAQPRVLFSSTALPAVVTPARGTVAETKSTTGEPDPPAKRRLLFGRVVNEITIQENVRLCYGIVKKLTGSIGGNASGGPIYGELTIGSMQKVVRIMKTLTGLDSSSRFIDVGSGIGKPSIHVAQDPGVAFSYGIEVEVDRWLLGMSCLKGIFDMAVKQSVCVPSETRIGHRCFFDLGDIRQAQKFDPFTHVYMFSIGYVTTENIDLALLCILDLMYLPF